MQWSEPSKPEREGKFNLHNSVYALPHFSNTTFAEYNPPFFSTIIDIHYCHQSVFISVLSPQNNCEITDKDYSELARVTAPFYL